jgi:hypothetical protein
VGSGRGAHEGESSMPLCGRSWTKPAPVVRGSSRRITIMRFRPANIRVIHRRNSFLDRDPRCFLEKRKNEKRKIKRSS